MRTLKIIMGITILFLYLGCKKQSSCKDVVQGDFEIVN